MVKWGMEPAHEAWRIDMFGGLRASRGASTLDRFQTQKTGALLAYLAFYPQRRHLREELIDLLWPDADAEAGRHRLSQALAWLRAQLEPTDALKNSVIAADRQRIGIQPSAVVTDVAIFEMSCAAFHKNPDDQAIRLALEAALAGYKDGLLRGYYDGWVLVERARLQDAYIEAARSLMRLYEQDTQYASGINLARRVLEDDPLAEEIHADLMRLLAADGQKAAALRHFKELGRLLDRELGGGPSAATLTLVEQIRKTDPPPPAAWLKFAGREPSLPAPLTRFFGRRDEIAQAQSLLRAEGARLLSLTGMGGGGKTRLAIEIARSLAGHYHGAVWFVPLADVTEARAIPNAIADSLGMQRSAAPSPGEIVAALRAREALIVLDNLELIAEDAAPLIATLLAKIPGLALLVTSRRRLGLDGEREIPVPPLQIPAGSRSECAAPATPEQLLGLDSVRLFVDRARAVRPAFQITPQNATPVAQLCERLEGIPLAIELCAAWIQTLTPTQMLSQLTRRFDLLVSRRSDIPPRHRTMRTALEYSYGQLPPALQQYFVRLSVFRGGWTLESADAICGERTGDQSPSAALTAMTALRERSLLLADEGGSERSEMRYRMLDTLRDFAAEHLAPAEAALRRRAHAEFFLDLAETAEPQLSGRNQSRWIAQLEVEHDNLRAALSWALEEWAAELGLRLASALSTFWDVRGYLSDGQEWLSKLLALPQPASPAPHLAAIRAKALNSYGYLARNQGHSDAVDTAMRESMTLWRSLGDDRGMATALMTLATVAYSRENCDEARALLEEGLSLARKLGDQKLVARALLSLGNIALEQGQWDQAWSHYGESLNLYQNLGIRNFTAYAFNNMGLVARYRGDLETAGGLIRNSLATCRELSERPGTAEALLNFGTIVRLEGRNAAARSLLREAADIAAQIGEKRLLLWCLKEMGHIAVAERSWEDGVRFLTAAETLRAAIGISFKPAGPIEIADDMKKCQEELGDAKFSVNRLVGSGLSLTDALTEAMANVCN